MRKRIQVEWSILAQADRDAIFDYIEADSPRAAITVDDRIREKVETLARFPQSGRAGRIEGTRELVISRTPYIVAYHIAVISSGSYVFCTGHGVGPMTCLKKRKNDSSPRISTLA